MLDTKKLAASLLAFILFGGTVENVGGIVPPARMVNDLIPGSPEEELYLKLSRGCGIDILGDAAFSPKHIKSLKKYIGLLIHERPGLSNDIDAAIAQNKILSLTNTLDDLRNRIAARYHDNATEKQGATRQVIENSTACLDAICTAIRIINGGLDENRAELQRRFEAAMQSVWDSYNGPLDGRGGGLAEVYERYWAHKDQTQGSARAVNAHFAQIAELIDALIMLVGSIADKATTEEKMKIFHYMYEAMCARSVGRFLWGHCNDINPMFEAQYDAWLAKHREVKPQDRTPGGA